MISKLGKFRNKFALSKIFLNCFVFWCRPFAAKYDEMTKDIGTIYDNARTGHSKGKIEYIWTRFSNYSSNKYLADIRYQTAGKGIWVPCKTLKTTFTFSHMFCHHLIVLPLFVILISLCLKDLEIHLQRVLSDRVKSIIPVELIFRGWLIDFLKIYHQMFKKICSRTSWMKRFLFRITTAVAVYFDIFIICNVTANDAAWYDLVHNMVREEESTNTICNCKVTQ